MTMLLVSPSSGMTELTMDTRGCQEKGRDMSPGTLLNIISVHQITSTYPSVRCDGLHEGYTYDQEPKHSNESICLGSCFPIQETVTRNLTPSGWLDGYTSHVFRPSHTLQWQDESSRTKQDRQVTASITHDYPCH
jgi:hypothetical protein